VAKAHGQWRRDQQRSLISWEPIDEMRTAIDQAIDRRNGYSAGLAYGHPSRQYTFRNCVIGCCQVWSADIRLAGDG